MKIDNDKQLNLIDNLTRTPSQNLKEQPGVAKREGKAYEDNVEISSKKAKVEEVKESAKAIPTVRTDVVEKLRDAIKSETYNVKGEMIAKGIIKSQILDQIM